MLAEPLDVTHLRPGRDLSGDARITSIDLLRAVLCFAECVAAGFGILHHLSESLHSKDNWPWPGTIGGSLRPE
jgi:hypothetical protein